MSRSMVTKSLAAAAIMGLFATYTATAQQTQPPNCTTNFVYFATGSHALTPECPSGRFVSLLNLLASGLERLESTVILSLAPIREVPHVDDRKPSPVRPGQAALPK